MQVAEKYSITKSSIASSFAQAAQTYDEYASLQREVADRLLEGVINQQPKRILDLGSGTGYCTDELKALFPSAEIISLDIAEGMLSYAKEKGEVNAVCADAESLPFVEGSFDLIVSSLAIQWCVNYPKLFSDLHRVLSCEGLICISTFGPATLQELKLAWEKVDNYVHVNRFVDKGDLKEILLAKEYAQIKIEADVLQRDYSSLKDLTKELKSIGAHNMNKGQSKGLGGRQKIVRLKSHFESSFVPESGIPVTYELYYLFLRKWV